MTVNPINNANTDTSMMRRAIVEGLQEYKERNSTVCLNVIVFSLNLGILITILIFCASILEDVASIKNKVAA
jgi:hypothetical protein